MRSRHLSFSRGRTAACVLMLTLVTVALPPRWQSIP